MVEKKTKKKTKNTEDTQLTRIIELLETSVEQGARLFHVLEGNNTTFKEVKPFGEKKHENIIETEAKQLLINQQGGTVELTYEVVKTEAQKLVKLDEHEGQKGFAKAKEIILGYNVARLEDVPKENYPEIIAQFRKAAKEWK